MDNFHSHTLRRVVSFNSIRTHDCPNCQCTTNHTSNHEVFPRPNSPGISFRNLNSFPVTKPTTCFINRPIINENNFVRQNLIKASPAENSIYLRKTDIIEQSTNFISPNPLKGSIQKRSYRIVSPARNSPNHINIRYVSPPRNGTQKFNLNIKAHHGYLQNSKVIEEKKPSIYFQKLKQDKNRSIQIDQPKKPSILLRKTYQNKKQKSKIEQNPSPTATKYSVQAYQSSQKQIDIGIVSTITNRSSIRSYPFTKNQVNIIQKQQSSPFSMIKTDQQDKEIANEIIKDLKLHYDYYSARELSQIVSNV